MNFQGLHRTIQFSISSLTRGEWQRLNISQIFCFANRFLKFFRFFFKTGSFSISRSAKFSALYQPRCIVAFDAQQKHNISSIFIFASAILKFFRFFLRTGSFSILQTAKKIRWYVSAPPHRRIRRATGNIIYQRFPILQADFQKKNAFFRSFLAFYPKICWKIQRSLDDLARWVGLVGRVGRAAKQTMRHSPT